jgi:hypothetical protein
VEPIKENNIKINAVDMYAVKNLRVVIATELRTLKINVTNFANCGGTTHPHYNLRPRNSFYYYMNIIFNSKARRRTTCDRVC